MKTLTCAPSWPPAETCLFWSSCVIFTPGARFAKLRKLRWFCGRYRTCSAVTLVDLRRLRFDEPVGRADDGHILAVDEVGRDSEAEGDILADQHLDGLRLRLVLL